MMKWKRIVSAAVCVCMAGMLITGCGSKSDSSSKKRIIRVALSQSEEHPEYNGMVPEVISIRNMLPFTRTCSRS